jgi:hypothetical protein
MSDVPCWEIKFLALWLLKLDVPVEMCIHATDFHFCNTAWLAGLFDQYF